MALCSHENDYEIVQSVWCSKCDDTITEDVTVCPGSGTYSWTCSKCDTDGWEKQ